MAEFTVNATRFDPYKNFKFRVRWDGRYVAGVSKVGALKRTTEVVKHRNGGDPSSSRKSPGRTEFEAVTLERGVTHDVDFEQWANKVWNYGSGLGAETSLKDFRKDVIVEVYNEAGQLAITYKLYRCWVSEFQALPDLDANANAVAIQTHQAGERGLGAGLLRHRADGTVLRRAVTALADPATLLAVWERAAGAHIAARTAVLVHGAGLVAALDDALDLDLGRCAALASAAHEEDFGPTVHAVAGCPGCGELVEAELPARVPMPPVGGTRAVGRWSVRPVTTRDLLHAARDGDPTLALLRRCVHDHGTGEAPDVVPEADLTAIDAASEELAGAAALVTVLSCPACGETVDVALDPGALLWDQVADAGTALLRDVAALAGAFGWGEDEVLALTPSRRRAYLTLAAP